MLRAESKLRLQALSTKANHGSPASDDAGSIAAVRLDAPCSAEESAPSEQSTLAVSVDWVPETSASLTSPPPSPSSTVAVSGHADEGMESDDDSAESDEGVPISIAPSSAATEEEEVEDSLLEEASRASHASRASFASRSTSKYRDRRSRPALQAAEIALQLPTSAAVEANDSESPSPQVPADCTLLPLEARWSTVPSPRALRASTYPLLGAPPAPPACPHGDAALAADRAPAPSCASWLLSACVPCMVSEERPLSDRLWTLEALASHPADDDLIGQAFLDVLNPSWRGWCGLGTSMRRMRLDSAAFGGVPGLTAYLRARARWTDRQVVRAAHDGCSQLVVLRSGFDTRTYRLSLPGVRCFEVDDALALAAKRRLLDVALPSDVVHPRPSFVAVDWEDLDTIIPALTAAGFDPVSRATFVLEGALTRLPKDKAAALLSEVGLLAAPGSLVLFDAVDQRYANGARCDKAFWRYAEAAAHREAPVRSGAPAGIEGLARWLRPARLRPVALLGPAQIAAAAHADLVGAVDRSDGLRSRSVGSDGCVWGAAQDAAATSALALSSSNTVVPAFLFMAAAVKAHPRSLVPLPYGHWEAGEAMDEIDEAEERKDADKGDVNDPLATSCLWDSLLQSIGLGSAPAPPAEPAVVELSAASGKQATPAAAPATPCSPARIPAQTAERSATPMVAPSASSSTAASYGPSRSGPNSRDDPHPRGAWGCGEETTHSPVSEASAESLAGPRPTSVFGALDEFGDETSEDAYLG